MRRAPKYRNVKTVVDGIKFDSKREAARYSELMLMERAGVIRGLELQPRYPVTINGVDIRYVGTNRHLTYVADFKYYDVERKEFVVEDAKGFATKDYRIKRALMAAMGLNVREI